MVTKNLSLDELNIIQAILLPFSERAKFPFTFDLLLNKWEKFVEEIEQGYNQSIYEYINDITTRDVIQAVLLSSPQPLRDKLVDIVESFDTRFYQATRKVNRALAQNKIPDQQPWWFRIPHILKDELKSDLQAEGVL